MPKISFRIMPAFRGSVSHVQTGAARKTHQSVPPLDYCPLADFIARSPAYLPALDQHLASGSGFSDIAAHEVDAAVTGLNSPHLIIRRHAVAVPGRRRLGKNVGRRVLPLLCRTIRQDPDAVVRRLAILSLLWWRIDSRQLAEVRRGVSGGRSAPGHRSPRVQVVLDRFAGSSPMPPFDGQGNALFRHEQMSGWPGRGGGVCRPTRPSLRPPNFGQLVDKARQQLRLERSYIAEHQQLIRR
ncbi:HEAT repeat domain-containing protein [Amycolatopsis sp. NPDC051045]|uniref:HEAT repeat domain-containing protein n=1 Tax=Amycolatopsis sp. NPDC051045 TaxID=3156922 RepID=UPI0034154D37